MSPLCGLGNEQQVDTALLFLAGLEKAELGCFTRDLPNKSWLFRLLGSIQVDLQSQNEEI